MPYRAPPQVNLQRMSMTCLLGSAGFCSEPRVLDLGALRKVEQFQFLATALLLFLPGHVTVRISAGDNSQPEFFRCAIPSSPSPPHQNGPERISGATMPLFPRFHKCAKKSILPSAEIRTWFYVKNLVPSSFLSKTIIAQEF